jgi:hypothetical protein
MDSESMELARRLVAHPKWEWRLGMIGYSPAYDSRFFVDEKERVPPVMGMGSYPDLDHPSTAGWLLGMLDDCYAVSIGRKEVDGWWLCECYPTNDSYYDDNAVVRSSTSKGAALARALLEVWGDA